MKVSAETRSKFEATPWVKPLEEEALHYLLGFSHIFSLLCSLKLPIVGHNVLLDLMMTYQQFYEPLPGINYHVINGA
jgi:poly(A)-specific ribonuclease